MEYTYHLAPWRDKSAPHATHSWPASPKSIEQPTETPAVDGHAKVTAADRTACSSSRSPLASTAMLRRFSLTTTAPGGTVSTQ